MATDAARCLNMRAGTVRTARWHVVTPGRERPPQVGLRQAWARVVMRCAAHPLRDGGAGVRFEELEPVAVGVVRVEASVPGEVVVPRHGHAGIAEVIREVVDARDQHAGVGFAGRSEVGLDTEMDLPATTAEPATTASTAGFSSSSMPSSRIASMMCAWPG